MRLSAPEHYLEHSKLQKRQHYAFCFSPIVFKETQDLLYQHLRSNYILPNPELIWTTGLALGHYDSSQSVYSTYNKSNLRGETLLSFHFLGVIQIILQLNSILIR